MNTQGDIRRETALAIRQSAARLKDRGALFGFALGTDDDVRTLFQVSCTIDWVRKSESECSDIGYIFVEWPDSLHDDLFLPISNKLALLADQAYASDEAWFKARDIRFHDMFLALKDCREAGVFDAQTFLFVGSTDPSIHSQKLSMRAVKELNTGGIASKYANVMGPISGPI